MVFSTLTCSRSIIPGTFFKVAAAPASATGFHSSPVFGSTFQLVRSGAPMIFAICGLTVVGTGTERAGTSSIAAPAVWACPAGDPTIPIAAHKSAVAPDFQVDLIHV